MTEEAQLSEDDVALVTGPEAARQLGLEQATIRQWKARGQLAMRDRDARGRPLYSLRDLWEVEHDLRTAGRGFRRRA